MKPRYPNQGTAQKIPSPMMPQDGYGQRTPEWGGDPKQMLANMLLGMSGMGQRSPRYRAGPAPIQQPGLADRFRIGMPISGQSSMASRFRSGGM